jgi:hypothetical protein
MISSIAANARSPPQPVHPARAHAMAVAAKKNADAPIAVAGYCADSAFIRPITAASFKAIRLG